ncbi:hypothetical protein ACUF8D_001337 [Klebsiella aerogenes]
MMPVFHGAKLAENIQAGAFAVRSNLFKSKVLKPLYEMWVKNELLNNRLEFSFTQLDQLNDCEFINQRKQSLDPIKDAQEVIMLVEAGLMSKQEAIAKRGGDPIITFQQIEQEKILTDNKEIESETDPNEGDDINPSE